MAETAAEREERLRKLKKSLEEGETEVPGSTSGTKAEKTERGDWITTPTVTGTAKAEDEGPGITAGEVAKVKKPVAPKKAFKDMTDAELKAYKAGSPIEGAQLKSEKRKRGIQASLESPMGSVVRERLQQRA